MKHQELYEREGVVGLLRPISDAQPGGVQTYHHPLVREIEQARRHDAALPQGVWQKERKLADWPKVASLSSRVLTQVSKDFRVATWLGQAWTEIYGWAGYRRGLSILLGLCEGFWGHAHPSLEEEGLEARLGPVTWYFDALAPRLRCLAFGETGGGMALSLDLWGQATRLEAVRARDARKAGALEAEGQLGTKAFAAEFETVPREELREFVSQLRSTQALFEPLTTMLEDLAGAEAPSLGPVIRTIEELEAMFARLVSGGMASLAPAPPPPAPAMDGVEGEPEDAGEGEGESAAEQPPRGVPLVPTIHDRDHAYRLLHEVAEYLARTEPHSPSPYLIRRVVSWGHLELDQLLPQLISKPDDLNAIFALLGLPRN